jgi:hypothetical protein
LHRLMLSWLVTSSWTALMPMASSSLSTSVFRAVAIT